MQSNWDLNIFLKLSFKEKTIIPSGSYLLKTVKKVLDEEGIPRIQRQDIMNYKIKNLLEAYLLNFWSEMYPDLSKDYQGLIRRRLY